MSKRKSTNLEQSTKKQKTEPQLKLPETVNITKRSHDATKENIPWAESDIHELLSKIEANIPKDDTVSYTCRLEKLNWENIVFNNYSVQECKEVWNALHKTVRKFRFLSEIVSDVKKLILQPKAGPKHPFKPKQPPNNFRFFLEEKRQEVMGENPTLSFAELSKQLGIMFRNLSPKEKETYNNKAKIARQEYLVKLQEFYDKHPEMIPKKSKRKRKSMELDEGHGIPKKPKTPFELFVQVESEREEVEPSRLAIQKYREQWHELTDKEKFFWINWAEEMYAKYLEELKEYIKVHPHYQPETIRYFLTKNEKKIKERCSGRPDKPPHGAYHLFSKMILSSEEAKKINKKDLLNYIAEQWRTCTEEEKRAYKTRVEQMWEEYHKKLDEYLMTLPPEERDRVREEESSRKKIRSEKKEQLKMTPAGKLTRPVPPPKNAYKHFARKYKGDEKPEIVWKNMQYDEKKKLKEEFDEAKKTYLIEFEQYLKSLNKEELQNLGSSLTVPYESSSSSESSTEEDEENEEEEGEKTN